MTYNEFRLRFAIQYVGSVSDPGECMRRMDNAPSLARLLWDVMNAPEVQAPPAPSFVSTAGLAPIAANSMELKELARKALEVSGDNAQWVAIDASGGVWAYDLRPQCYEIDTMWDNTPDQGFNWHVCTIAPPDNFRDELYEISKLLNDDTE